MGCLPHGNPWPSEKFHSKLAWPNRLTAYAADLLELDVSLILVGAYNVMPTPLDIYNRERWVDDALYRIEVRDAYKRLVDQGWTDDLRQLAASFSR